MTNLKSLVMIKRRQNPGIGILIFLMLNVIWITNIQAQPGWEEMPPMPTSRAVFKSVLHDGKIYAIGGLKSVNPPYGIETEVYDTETGEWSDKASMENPCSGLSVEILNNKIYVIGGAYSAKQQYTVIQEYDIETDTWSTKCTMPEPRFNHISEVIDGKIYIAGGFTIDENGRHPGLTSARVYDPVQDHWDTIADLNHERVFGRSCVFNNKIYVFGGAPPGLPPRPVAHQSIEIYDPETDVWTISEDEIPVPFMGGMVQVYGDSILLFGGFRFLLDKENYSCIYKYVPDAAEDKWKEMVSMPVKRGVMAGNIVDHYLHMIGGYDGFQNDEVEISQDNHWRLDLDSLKAFIPVTGISLDKDSMELNGSETATLFATVTPANASDPSILWSTRGSDIAIVDNGIVTGVAVGQTYIYARTADGNYKDSCHITVIPGVGIANAKANRLFIFPNPTKDLLTIGTVNSDHYSIEITSLNGQLINSSEMVGTSHQIDLSSFQKGIYFITIRTEDFVTMRKIIKL